MRTFWQSIALLLLVAFAPATVHCLAGGTNVHAQKVTVLDACCHHGEQHPDSNTGNEPPSHSEHECPTETLAKTNLPAPLLVPALPCQILDEALVALRHLASQMMMTEASDTEALASTTPREWITTWVFASRAALPPRSPSDLA